jgi:type I restriction enzyme M protein
VNAAFSWCHQHIYRKGDISQAAGFEEFVKVVFLKLLSDRRVKEKYPELAAREVFDVPAADVRFSSRWIRDRESDTPNPLDTIQFHELLDQIENEIAAGTRRRIFKRGDRINLNPEIIKGVVARLEHVYLFGVDADLNGRLFETFLTATMRGKDLGQFFTPRSIVKLGTKLADIKVSKSRTEIVLDACCGTGGFLIDALADMWAKTEASNTLGRRDKEELKQTIATERIYGVDVGREPNMARLARMNMYLHGDGGSSIYEADALDKEIVVQPNDSPEVSGEKGQLKTLLVGREFADVVLTNPPFAKEYGDSTATERRIRKRYELATTGRKGRKVERKRLRSSLMFIERYHDILRTGGRLITVIDDGILSGQDYDWFRDFLRQRFVVRAVVSLPGDAFQRSQARVKTSLLLLEKTAVGEAPSRQGDVFMYPCRFVGIDDPARRRVMPIDRENRRLANEEIVHAVACYQAFLKGETEWT